MIIRSIREAAQRPEDVVYPSPEDEPCLWLPVKTGGLRCTANVNELRCRSIYPTIRTIQEHCKETHGWMNTQKRGDNMRQRSKHTPNRLWEEEQAYQQFFRAVGWQRLFPVRVERVTFHTQTVDKEQREQRAQRVFAEYCDRIQEAKQQRAIKENTNRMVPNA